MTHPIDPRVTEALDAIARDPWLAGTPAPTPDLLLLSEPEALALAVAEAQSYRELAQAALTALHDQARELERAREQSAHLRDEIRRYTAAVVAEGT